MTRSYTVLAIGILFLPSAFAAKKVTSPSTTAANETVDLSATIFLNEADVKQKLGADPGPGIVLVQVKVTPKTDTPLQISPDDFVLIANDNGERHQPFDPAEIAGSGAMVVKDAGEKKEHKGGIMADFGGFGGGGGSPGNSKPVNLAGKMDDKSKGNDTLLNALQAKQFPGKASTEPVEGYLYFPLEGKHKLKNLEILYRGPAGKLNLEFEH